MTIQRRSNLSEYVSRTRRDQYDGAIDKITVNLLENIPFLEQVETALRSIFDLSRVHVPFKMAVAFGFLLYNPQTDSFETFYINDHLSRDAEDFRLTGRFLFTKSSVCDQSLTS